MPESLGVYVHFPWCLQKCPYCDFLSVPAERSALPHQAYARAVKNELAARARELEGYRLESIFFGGGTPSLWEPAELGGVLRAILQALPHDDVEITVECNPSSLDSERARALHEAGANRLSIGVQSLDRGRLEFLGRLHDPDSALRAVEGALAAGLPRVSADLIFGVSGQSPEDACREASTLAATGITHLSAYALTIEPGTRFGELARAGRLPLLAEADVADSFAGVEAALAGLSFEHYEISNYAKPGQRSRHNLGYWRGQDYLGLGTGAWGTWRTPEGRFRYRNAPSAERYMKGWLEGSAPSLDQKSELVSELEAITPEIALRERLMLGLRLVEGVDTQGLERETGVALGAKRTKASTRLAQRGLLEVDGARWRIPRSKWLLADGVIAELM